MHDPGQDEGYDNEIDMYMDEEEEYEEDMASDGINEEDFLAKSGKINTNIKKHLIGQEEYSKNSQYVYEMKQQIQNKQKNGMGDDGPSENFEYDENEDDKSRQFQEDEQYSDLEGAELGGVNLDESGMIGTSVINNNESDVVLDSPQIPNHSYKVKNKKFADLEIDLAQIGEDTALIPNNKYNQNNDFQNQQKNVERIKNVNQKNNNIVNDYSEAPNLALGRNPILASENIVSSQVYSNISGQRNNKNRLDYGLLNKNEQLKEEKQTINDNQKIIQNKISMGDKVDAGQDDYSQEEISADDYGMNLVQKQKVQAEQLVVDIKTSQKLIETCTSDNDTFPQNKPVEDSNEPQTSESNSNNNNVDIQNDNLSDAKDQEVIKLNEAQMSKEVIMKQISKQELNLKPHERKIGQYIIGKTIGEGTFGKVKIGTHILTKSKVAVKILEKSKILDVADVERVSREIHILKIVQHPHVVQLYEIIETPKKLYLIMEFASGGELFDYIVKHQRVQEKEACKFFQQLLSGIEYVSRLNIVHRDLKPENLLLDFDKGIKIVDFGLSNTYKTGELLKTACGSPCYAAPEMIAGKKYNGTNVDIWSCGVILFALICGYLPFEDPNTSNLYKKILSADFQTPNYVSDEAKDLFHCILNTDPEKRYTIEQIRKHPWFNIVQCESNFKGIQVGVDPVPIDSQLLSRMQTEFDIDSNYARKCIQANKHNHVTASYYLLLKEIIKKGEKSIADVRSPDYNPKLFIPSTKNIRLEKMREKLENASIQGKDENNGEMDANEIEDYKGSQEIENFHIDEDGQIIVSQGSEAEQSSRGINKEAKQEISKIDQNNKKINAQKSIKNESRKASPSGKTTAYSNQPIKSTQPQRLRKIADGLHEFERYADRKKRLQTISDKQQREQRVKDMNMQLSQNRTAEDMLSNGGGFDLLKRGLSPIAADGPTIPDTISYDLGYNNQQSIDPNLLFTNNFVDFNEFGEPSIVHVDRDQSPGLSPHTIRVNAQRGANGMQTQYGNFLYQNEAKQFPNQFNNQPQVVKQQNIKLQNQKTNENQRIPKKINNKIPQIDTNNFNTKQIHKQLKQFYMQQKKNPNINQEKNASELQLQFQNQEALLKNLVVNLNASQGSSGNSMQQKIINPATGSGKVIQNKNGLKSKNMSMLAPNGTTSSQLSKFQHMQQNYQQKKINLVDNQSGNTTGNENQNFSTIQTAFATLQLNNQSIQTNNQNFQNKKKNSQGAPIVQSFQPQANSHGGNAALMSQLTNQLINTTHSGKTAAHHQRFATTQYGTANSGLNTISQNFGGRPGVNQFNMLNESAQSAISANSPEGYSGAQIEVFNQKASKFTSKTQSTFLQGVVKNGNKLNNSKQQNSVRKQQNQQQQGKNNINQNSKAAGSGSLGPVQRHVGIFSPKNLPSGNLVFGFGVNNMDNILTPQTHINNQTQLMPVGGNPNHLFTIDTTSQGLTQPLVMASQNTIPNQTVQLSLSQNNTIRNQRTVNSFVNQVGGAQSLKPQTLPRKSSQIQQQLKQQFHQIVTTPSSVTNPGSAGGVIQIGQKGIISNSQADQNFQRQANNKRKINNQKQTGGIQQQQHFMHQNQLIQQTQQSNISMIHCNQGSSSNNNGQALSINHYQNQLRRRDNPQKQNVVGKIQTQNTQNLTIKNKSESAGKSNEFKSIQYQQTDNKSKNNLNKPPLGLLGTITNVNDKSAINCSFTTTQPIQFSGGGGSLEKRLSNTAAHIPQSSQKKFSKQRTNNSKNAKTSSKKITDTNQVNISINQGIPHNYGNVGAIGSSLSAKNSNIFSPIVLANSRKTGGATGIGMQADTYMLMVENYNQAHLNQALQQQQAQYIQQEQMKNLSRIQAQLQLKKQQRQQQTAPSMNASSTTYQQTQTNQQQVGAVSMRNNTKYPNQNGNFINQLEETHSAVIHQMQRNAEQFAQSSSPQNHVPGIQMKKGSNVMNNSLMVSNCAPHALLQNYHGTGYPPMGNQMSNQPPISALISPHNVQFSPQATIYNSLNNHLQVFHSIQSPQQHLQQNQMNESLLQFVGNSNNNQRQNMGGSTGPSQKQGNQSNQQNRRKTPQIVTSDEVLNPQSLNSNNQLMLSTGMTMSNHNTIQISQTTGGQLHPKKIGNGASGSMTSTNKQKQRNNNLLNNINKKVQKENSQMKFDDQQAASPGNSTSQWNKKQIRGGPIQNFSDEIKLTS